MFSILSIFIIMKIENGIEEKDEHSHRLEILNQNSNSDLLGVDPWIDWVFILSWSSSMEDPRNLCKKKEEHKWKEEEEWRTIERKSLILKLAQKVTKFVCGTKWSN